MRNVLKDVSTSILILSILSALLGVVLIVYPGFSLFALGVVAAAYLIVQGLTLIVLDVRAWRMYLPFEGFLPGVLSIILGVLLALRPESIAVYVGVYLGLWVILSGFVGIKLACSLRWVGANWVPMLLLNVLDILIGIVILFTPVFSSLSLTVCLGAVILYHSIVNLIDMVTVKRNISHLEKLIFKKRAP